MRTIPREVPDVFANSTTFEFEVDDYNEYFLNQLFEILTEYGEIHEVWFDGRTRRGKEGRPTTTRHGELIRTLAPKRSSLTRGYPLVGNEAGATRIRSGT